MGFTPKETVCLIGAHCMGRAHTTASGFKGAWTTTPNQFTDKFYKDLKSKIWTQTTVNATGNIQYESPNNPEPLMMLPGDYGLMNYTVYQPHFDFYAANVGGVFETDFAIAWVKLIELGMSDAYAKQQFAAGCTDPPAAATTGAEGSSGIALAASVLASALAVVAAL
jgi:cytochrome c peroxidase